jgi:hypothetical protein
MFKYKRFEIRNYVTCTTNCNYRTRNIVCFRCITVNTQHKAINIIIVIMEAVCDYEYGICRAIIAAAIDTYLKLMNI